MLIYMHMLIVLYVTTCYILCHVIISVWHQQVQEVNAQPFNLLGTLELSPKLEEHILVYTCYMMLYVLTNASGFTG